MWKDKGHYDWLNMIGHMAPGWMVIDSLFQNHWLELDRVVPRVQRCYRTQGRQPLGVREHQWPLSGGWLRLLWGIEEFVAALRRCHSSQPCFRNRLKAMRAF